MSVATPCFHCGLEVPENCDYSVDIDGTHQPMCCPGCQAVAQTIIDTGLSDYYRYRTSEAMTGNVMEQTLLEELQLYDRADLQKDFVTSSASGDAEALLIIEGITCAACIWLIEHQLSNLNGLSSCSVNLSTGRARVHWDAERLQLSTILSKIYKIGYRAHPYYVDRQDRIIQRENRQYLRRIGVAGIAMMQVMMYAIAMYAGSFEDMAAEHKIFLRWISLLLTTPVVFYSAQPFFSAAWRNLKTRHLSMDLPVSLAIGAAYTASLWSTISDGQEVYFDSVTMFTFFLLSGRFLEFRARLKLDLHNNTLSRLLPESVQRITDDQLQTIALRDLCVGDEILIKTGQVVPADGVILKGLSSVDESQMTGEFKAQSKVPGNSVIAGSYNLENPIWIEVTAVGGQTRLSGVLRLLDQARANKPPIAIIADRIAQYFIAAVLVIASSVAISWYFFAPDKAFWITLSVLVVTCPCALSLATPTALTAATGYLASRGFLISHGHALEGLAQADRIIFDKTGTLTEGQLQIKAIHTVQQGTEEQCYQIAAAIEACSEHPVARAFKQSSLRASDIRIVPGSGIEGIVNGQPYRLGTPRYVSELSGNRYSEIPPGADPDTNNGTNQYVLLGDPKGTLAWFELEDQLRPGCNEMLQSLKRTGFHIELLSGDTSDHVQAVAQQLGITHATAGASPADKMARVQALQRLGHQVVMVGDGINDVPVLAVADVSVAMTSASDLTRITADAVLLSGNLLDLVRAIDTARSCRRVIKQNIGWAILYNMAALPLAAMGWVPPYLAAIGMSCSSLLVVLNALRLGRADRRPATGESV